MDLVTPCAGVWIEMPVRTIWELSGWVTPCAGVWIEIRRNWVEITMLSWSLPVRECGLKWFSPLSCKGIKSHSLCGSVD